MEQQTTTEPLTGKSTSTTSAKDQGPAKWRSARFTLAYIMLLGNAVIFLQRVTFSMAIVCMVNHTALDVALASSSSAAANHTIIITSSNTTTTTAIKNSINNINVGGARRTSGAEFDVTFGGVGPSSGNESQLLRDTSGGVAGAGFDSDGGGGGVGAGGGGGGSGSFKYYDYFANGSARGVGSTDDAAGEGGGGRGTAGKETGGGPCDRDLGGENGGGGAKEKEDGPFVWDKDTQGLLLGAVYWGYMAMQIPASYTLYRYGPRLICFISTMTMSILTILCYPAAFLSPWAVFALRVGAGGCTAFAIPGFFCMWGKWAPIEERATLLGVSFSGQNVANTLSFPVAALLCKYGFAGGWPSVFCVSGGVGLLWCVAWILLVSDSPETLKRTHPAERDYIMATRGSSHSKGEKIAVPWCQMISSMCFWAILVAHVTFTWGLFLFMSNLPLFMYEVMNFDIKSNGVYSMMPYIALGFVQALSGFSADMVMKRQILNRFWTRRLFYSLSSVVPAVLLVAMSFLDCQHVAAVMTLLVLSVGFTGFAFSGFLVNSYDIAPHYAISITSITNTAACMPGILTPYVVAEVTPDKTREQWQIIFFITAAIYLCGTTFFCVFVKTSVQPWASPPTQVVEIGFKDLDPDAGCNGQAGEGHTAVSTESKALCMTDPDILGSDLENGGISEHE